MADGPADIRQLGVAFTGGGVGRWDHSDAWLAGWLAGAAVRDGTLVQILAQWEGAEVGGIYAVMPPGRLVPTKTRVFVDQITRAIQAGWQQ